MLRFSIALLILLALLPQSLPAEQVPPNLGCWFWHEEEFEPEGYRKYLDLIAEKSHYQILTTSLRVKDRELTDPQTIDQISKAVGYAQNLGIGIAMDLDLRLARTQFQKLYPDEMQWMVRLRDEVLDEEGRGEIRIESALLTDHYTHQAIDYVSLAGELWGAFLFDRGEDGIRSESIEELNEGFEILVESPEEVAIRVDAGPEAAGKTLCAMVAFEHFTPDVFAPHLLEYQESLLELYRDIPLVGVCKDEWGFPPDFNGCPEKNDYWFSENRARAYKEETGRELTQDFLLMTYGEEGKEQQRNAAINHLLRMSTLRNGEVETHFYSITKEIFGEEALVATHPTWYPFPSVQEFKKNGLNWWIAKRDFAQTDETTPYSVRTSLAKKWGSPVWYNMYYSEDPANYSSMMWRDAMTGGRMNDHPPWPMTLTGTLLAGMDAILKPDRILGRSRIHLLDFISSTPLDCPVAIIFGHTRAMNWTSPDYANTGVALADRFWEAGYPADLIPSSEIWNGSLKISASGKLLYGLQEYETAVLLFPEFEPGESEEFLTELEFEKAGLILVGDRTLNFKGEKATFFSKIWPKELSASSDEEAFQKGLALLQERRVAARSPSTSKLEGFGYQSSAPPPSGTTRLIDGTHLFFHALKSPAGDPVSSVFRVGGHQFFADFEGVLGIRFDEGGGIQTLAAGGLKEFHSKDLHLDLDDRFDFAIKRGSSGEWVGTHLGPTGSVPEDFDDLAIDWSFRRHRVE